MSFVVKTAPIRMASGQTVRIEERAMYGGRNATEGDRIYIWTSEQEGGVGLSGFGHILRVDAFGQSIAVEVQVEICSTTRRFGNFDIAPYRDIDDGSAISGIAHKLYRQSHNKIAALNVSEAALLDQYLS